MDDTTFQFVVYNQASVLVLLVIFSPSESTLKAPHRDMKCCGQFSGVSWLSRGPVRAESFFTASTKKSLSLDYKWRPDGLVCFSLLVSEHFEWHEKWNETPIFGLLVCVCACTCACNRLCKWETGIMSLEARESKNTGTLQMGFIERKWQGPLLFSILHIASEKSGCDNQTVHS